jgi:hypothetical protein
LVDAGHVKYQSYINHAGGDGGVGIGRSHSNATAKDLMLGTPGRVTHMNTSASTGAYAMSNVVYGFRPESAWPGVLFQVILQGPCIPVWQKQKDVAYWLSFGGISVKPAFYEMESTVSLPDIGTKRYILQCIVPEPTTNSRKVTVNLSVHGVGGKTIVQSLLLGVFEYKDNGNYILYLFF